MNKLIVSALTLLISVNLCFASSKEENQQKTIKNWLQTEAIEIHLPAFNTIEDFNGSTFELKNLLQENQLDLCKITPKANDQFSWNGKILTWKEKRANSKGFVSLPNKANQLYYFVSYFNTNQWSKFDLKLNSFPMVEIYVDGVKKLSHYKHEDEEAKELSESLQLEQGHHKIVVKILSGAKNNKFKLNLIAKKDWNSELFDLSLSPKQFIDINKVLDGTKVKSTALSFDGKYALISYSRTLPPSDKTENWKEIQEIATGNIIRSFRGSQLSSIKWLPIGSKISYTKSYNGKTSIFAFDFQKQEEQQISANISDFSGYNWAPNGQFIIYSTNKDHSKEWKLRKFQGMEDRLPWYRNRSFLYKLDVESGVKQRLTYGTLSTNLADISSDGKHILFTTSRPDYSDYPYFKQNLYQMNVQTFAVDTLWKDKLVAGYAQYSPDGKQLLVQGGPSCFGKIGENIGNHPIANNYDGQLYIYDLASKNVEPLTYNFDPAISNAVWNKKDQKIYIKAQDKDYECLFAYNLASKEFSKLNTKSDVVRNFDLSDNGETISYVACSISSPNKAFVYELNSKKVNIISNPEKEHLVNVQFGKTEDWNFTKEDGTTIIGRAYYPPNFDANKKYPMIVNYYGGTSPVERSFGGRYPLNMYAAMGYVVYLLQPSGATGFGQEFSARHQNNWGITTADEIIEGTKKFMKAHPFVDADKVGCIGASYGGFTTQLLQTRTDIFAAAISHAGISDITSYWGEGYWGYSYSMNATGKSFPWNRKDIYVDQSPLFNADKITTPMLLLHGSVDTNVPLGESIQMYQALKLLGKDVDFVQVNGQNHLIQNYTKRILWNNTIFAYFAKYLKDQPQWWNNLYPDKNL
ncbi:prolyl oligopeptidase family serine peptidase [Marinifilum sp. N1E240]|uniref:S9 family peptidase n=1 Tax=Marinifilum sp. N1E240 TaxID=2608082 RepID=UPI00128DB6F1|nr:prolyl oligopeptidase family serine peptidase [Marinifilum sp. N1E240]MPQ47522.1 prolyl oligopeptidase family serine peptidase [Marinifilum sp. N1E240]